jgi:hypothetical protein
MTDHFKHQTNVTVLSVLNTGNTGQFACLSLVVFILRNLVVFILRNLCLEFPSIYLLNII